MTSRGEGRGRADGRARVAARWAEAARADAAADRAMAEACRGAVGPTAADDAGVAEGLIGRGSAGTSRSTGGKRRGNGRPQATLPGVRRKAGNGRRWGGRREGAGRKPA